VIAGSGRRFIGLRFMVFLNAEEFLTPNGGFLSSCLLEIGLAVGSTSIPQCRTLQALQFTMEIRSFRATFRLLPREGGLRAVAKRHGENWLLRGDTFLNCN
jgi:hypothetical protein